LPSLDYGIVATYLLDSRGGKSITLFRTGQPLPLQALYSDPAFGRLLNSYFSALSVQNNGDARVKAKNRETLRANYATGMAEYKFIPYISYLSNDRGST